MEENILEKQRPKNLEAERALIASLLINNKAYEKISEILKPTDFAEQAHGKIYEACVKIIERGHLADPITLKNYLEQDGELSEAGGAEYLMDLATNTKTIINVADYARLIKDRAIRRELIDIGENIVNQAHADDLETTAFDQIELAEQKLFDLATIGQSSTGFISFANSLNTAIQNTEYAFKSEGHVSGLSTGFRDMDKMMGGLHPSDLIIIAGRPGMGKTAFGLELAFNAASEVYSKRANKELSGPVAFFSLEMSADQLAARVLSNQSEISYHKMRTGNISDEEFEIIAERSRMLDKYPLFIDDTPGISVPAIRTRARRLKRIHGNLAMVVVDYIQLLSAPGGGRQENRVQEISQMTRGLKIMAKELEVPVIALSQLSRQVEQRENKKPQLADLRESGSIEQDADIVMFLYREFYYHLMNEPSDPNSEKYLAWQEKAQRIRNRAEIMIEKQRHGPTGIIPLFFNPQVFKFGDYYEDNSPPSA
jgi:replicative DNA helicase